MDYNWNGKVILIAEDDLLNFILLQKMLEQTNATIMRTENGQEILDFIEKDKEIDLILMDLNMPKMNGDITTKMLRERGCKIPIIIQSATSDDDDIDKLMALGCDLFLKKPIDKEVLLENIDALISK